MSEQALKVKRSFARLFLILLVVGPILLYLGSPLTSAKDRKYIKQVQGKNILKQIGIDLYERYEMAKEKGEKAYFPELTMSAMEVFEYYEVDPFFQKPYKYSGEKIGKYRVAVGEEIHESLLKENVRLVLVDAIGYDYETGEEKEIYNLRGDMSVMHTGRLKLTPEPKAYWTAGKALFLIWALLFFGSAFYLSKTQKKGEQDVVGLLGSTLFSVVAAFALFFIVIFVLKEFF